jgi:release factor glutamine methyltransferase
VTVAEALRLASRRLAKAGVPFAEADAELLLRHAAGWDRARLVTDADRELAPDLEARFLALVEGRARRRPVQHILGTQHFWRHEFVVTPDVLIPRPETEVLVETALELLRDIPSPFVVDVGTGSGCIALSLAAERPDAVVHAVDLSAAALRVARQNARRLGLADRVLWHEGDLLEPVEELAGRATIVVSNPPYVGAAEIPGLAPEVRDHEPRIALEPPGGCSALYARLAAQALPFLAPEGWLVVEIGQGMESAVAALLAAAGFAIVKAVPDLRSIPRTLVARKPQ